MASSGSAYPFSPRSNAHLEPGQFWGIQLSDGGYACGVVIFPRPIDSGHGSRSIFCGGLLDWWGPEPPTAAGIGGAGFLRISNTFVDSIRRNDGMILGRRPLPPDAPAHPVMVSGLGDSFSQLAELRWGPKAIELPHLLLRAGPGHLDDIQEPSPSPLGHLWVSLPLADSELAQVGDWLGHHPHFSASAVGRSRRLIDVEFLKAFRSVSDVGVTCDHVEDWSGLRHLRSDLEQLKLGSIGAGADLSTLARFERLRRLEFSQGRPDLKALALVPSVEAVHLRGLDRADLTPLDRLPHLRELSLLEVTARNLDGVGRSAVEDLQIERVRALKALPWLASMTNLQRLSITQQRLVEALPDLGPLGALHTVWLDRVGPLPDLTPISSAPVLEELCVSPPPERDADSFQGFRGHPTLRRGSLDAGSRAGNEAVRELVGDLDRSPEFAAHRQRQ